MIHDRSMTLLVEGSCDTAVLAQLENKIDYSFLSWGRCIWLPEKIDRLRDICNSHLMLAFML